MKSHSSETNCALMRVWRFRVVSVLFVATMTSVSWAADPVSSPASRQLPERTTNAREDLDLCAPMRSAVFRSMQSCVRCDRRRTCSPTELLMSESQQAVLRGDMALAIEKMETAVARDLRISAGVGPWLELAELYCVQASRESETAAAEILRRRGRDLLREFECAQEFGRVRHCALPNWRNEASRERQDGVSIVKPNSVPWGFIPNPELTPMCFLAFCGPGFQNDEDGERRGADLRGSESDALGDVEEIESREAENSRIVMRLRLAVENLCKAKSGVAK